MHSCLDIMASKQTLSSGCALGFGLFTAIICKHRALTITYFRRTSSDGYYRGYLIFLSLIAHAAFTHRQLMRHSRTASSCGIHTPPAHAAFTHRQLMRHSRTASLCSIHTPPAHAAFTHCQYPILTFWGRTRPRVNPGNCQIVHRSFPLDRPLYCTGCTCGLEVKLGAEPPGIPTSKCSHSKTGFTRMTMNQWA